MNEYVNVCLFNVSQAMINAANAETPDDERCWKVAAIAWQIAAQYPESYALFNHATCLWDYAEGSSLDYADAFVGSA